MFAPPESQRKTGVKIIDWEFAAVGDPCWDAGAIFSNYLSFWLLAIPITGEEPPDRFLELSSYRLQDMQPAIRAFWRGYVRGLGLDPAMLNDWLLRAVRYAAARLLQTAFEQLQTVAYINGNVGYRRATQPEHPAATGRGGGPSARCPPAVVVVSMSEHAARVTEAIEAVSFPSKDSYAWFGQASPLLPARVRSALTARTARNYLLTSLQARLDQDLYLSGVASPRQSDAVTTAPAGRAPFIMTLSKANSGHGYWERGWEIGGAEGDYLHVARGGLQMRARREESSLAPDTSPCVGADVNLRFPKEFLNLSPGFYLAAGNQPLEVAPPQFVIRLGTGTVTAAAAVTFVSVATALLNQAGLPFRLKVLNDASAFDRRDAGVIYLPKADCAGSSAYLFDIYRTLRVSVKPGVPALTWRLAAGFGFAEDPLERKVSASTAAACWPTA